MYSMCDHAMQSFIEPLAIRCQPNPLNFEERRIPDCGRGMAQGLRAPLRCLQISHRHKTRLDVGLGQMLEAKIRKFTSFPIEVLVYD